MGKEVLSGLIESEAKAAIAEAAPLVTANSSMAQLMEQVGKGCRKDLDRLKAEHGDKMPKLKMIVRIVPAKGGA